MPLDWLPHHVSGEGSELNTPIFRVSQWRPSASLPTYMCHALMHTSCVAVVLIAMLGVALPTVLKLLAGRDLPAQVPLPVRAGIETKELIPER